MNPACSYTRLSVLRPGHTVQHCAQHFSVHVTTRCNMLHNICWLLLIKKDIAKLAKPKTGKYVEQQLRFLVLDTR